MTKILITGACGQLGSELTAELRSIFGENNVIATDISGPGKPDMNGPFKTVDVLDKPALEEIIDEYKITEIYHLAAMLSANAEQKIALAWKINVEGLLNVLNIAKEKTIHKVFWPSSIAVFGRDAVKVKTPQGSPCNPATVYGISKLAGEQWCAYYHRRFGIDVRSLRYPGLIGYKSLPGGGTTDYAVEIFHKALKGEKFHCFLDKQSRLPMMYMSDAVKASIDLMDSPSERLTVRTSYNVAAISFSPEEITTAIQQHIPDFEVSYQPDYRQQIADSWPDSIDDSTARDDWGWKPEFDLKKMTDDMIRNLPGFIKDIEDRDESL